MNNRDILKQLVNNHNAIGGWQMKVTFEEGVFTVYEIVSPMNDTFIHNDFDSMGELISWIQGSVAYLRGDIKNPEDLDSQYVQNEHDGFIEVFEKGLYEDTLISKFEDERDADRFIDGARTSDWLNEE